MESHYARDGITISGEDSGDRQEQDGAQQGHVRQDAQRVRGKTIPAAIEKSKAERAGGFRSAEHRPMLMQQDQRGNADTP